MTQELLERTIRDWVQVNPGRGARELDRLAGPRLSPGQSAQEIADALIRLAGQKELAQSRVW